ncbi:MAG: HD domain-containing protein [Clostridia bacterium]
MEKPFSHLAIVPGNHKYEACVKRPGTLPERESDVRTPFGRDYTRILHTRAYSRLKHKTQVFFATRNDHICTRIEHVNHVSSISTGICKFLGLNEELALAIATGHDLGHAPFGHTGERILDDLAQKDANLPFFHEMNSLRFVDLHETLQNSQGYETNLNLTYAVRDGILFHCGEVLDRVLFPRDTLLELEKVEGINQHAPYTWEGCVVKVSDIVAYIGRDIEDALRLRILDGEHEVLLANILSSYADIDIKKSNNTSLIHHLVTDLCQNSNPEEGLHFSRDYNRFIKDILAFNYEHIYNNPRLVVFHKYAELILGSIHELLSGFYRGRDTISYMEEEYLHIYPELCKTFISKLLKYSDLRDENISSNTLLYKMEDRQSYALAVIDYLSSLTDFYAIKLFEEITSL